MIQSSRTESFMQYARRHTLTMLSYNIYSLESCLEPYDISIKLLVYTLENANILLVPSA